MKGVRGMLLAGAAVVAAIIVVISKQADPARNDAHVAGPTTAAGEALLPEKSKSTPAPRPESSPRAELPLPVESPHRLDSADQLDWISARKAELDRLAWYDDNESLNRILAELRNTLPEIRKAALAATISFGSRDAVPHLEKVAATTSDPREKNSLLEAIDFLKLATVTEYLEEQPEKAPQDAPSE